MRDDVSEEPVFQATRAPSASDDAGVWGEPALASASAAGAARAERRAWVAEQWETFGKGRRLKVFLGLCAISGTMAVLCALMKGSLGFASLAVIFGAPVVEEVSKALGPLMVLEKRPWCFGSFSSIVIVGLVSGLVFASIENVLYFFVYIPSDKLTPGVVLWRLAACTAVHVAGAVLSCTGLARAWRRAATTKGEFEMASAVPWFFAAMALHAAYNFGAVVYSILVR